MLRLFPALALVLSLGLAGPGTVSAAPLITVETAPGDDAAIIDGVKRTHAPDPRTKLFEVTAETSGGITVLKGRTDSAEALSDLRAAYYVQKRPVDVRVKLLPDSDDLKKKVWAFTTAPVTRITDLSGRPVTTVPAGTPAARLDEKDGMTLLRLPDGSIGLARSTDVRPCTETEILIRNRHERLIVTADKASSSPCRRKAPRPPTSCCPAVRSFALTARATASCAPRSPTGVAAPSRSPPSRSSPTSSVARRANAEAIPPPS